MKNNIKKGDSVVILSGGDKGKKGNIIEVSLKKGKIKVEGVNIITKHSKPRAQGQKGGIIRKEAFIDLSNVRLNAPKKRASKINEAQ